MSLKYMMKGDCTPQEPNRTYLGLLTLKKIYQVLHGSIITTEYNLERIRDVDIGPVSISEEFILEFNSWVILVSRPTRWKDKQLSSLRYFSEC